MQSQTSDRLESYLLIANLSWLLLVALCATSMTSGQVDAQAQAQAYIEITRPIKFNTISSSSSSSSSSSQSSNNPLLTTTELLRNKQHSNIAIQQPPISTQPREPGSIRLTITNEPSIRGAGNGVMGSYGRIENMIGLADRLVNAISRPANVISLIRFVILALSSLLMSTIIFPLSDFTKTRARHTGGHNGATSQMNPNNNQAENLIELFIKSYDETMKRAGIVDDTSLCRERTLCIMGDRMACDFPSFTYILDKLAQNYLLPIEGNKNKYTKALMLGLNQTNCDRAYRAADCPSLRDNVRTYFYGTRRRRDRFNWRKP